MKRYRLSIAIITLALANLAGAAPLLFLKGDRLYSLTSDLEPVYITSQVTRVVPTAGLFLKEDRLYHLNSDGSYEYVTQQVSEVCDDARFLIKQSKLYVIDTDLSPVYITSGVTSCRSR